MTTAPTGQEHVTPVAITDTSATERAVFRRCRRQWFLSVVHRLDGQGGNVNFFLGTLYHAALAAYYTALKNGLGVDDAEIASLDTYQDTYDDMADDVKASLGFLATMNFPEFQTAGEMGLEMLQNYLVRERDEPLFDEVIAVEFRVNVPIPGTTGMLSVQADCVGLRHGYLGIGEHKTASSVMPSGHLDIDDQLTAEVYSWWKATGDFPEWVAYNVSYKRVPHPPKLLKSGKLSKDKGQLTTGLMYREAIRQHGLPLGDYADFLTWLDESERRGESRLFRREETFRTKSQMAAFERDLTEEWLDMTWISVLREAGGKVQTLRFS